MSVRPGSKTVLRNLGRAHWRRGQLEEAVRSFRHAVRLDPQDCNSWTQLSAALLGKNDPEAGLEAADRAMGLNPDYAFAHNSRGAVLQRVGNHRDALSAFDQALDLEMRAGWESAGTYNNRGFSRMRLGDFTGAVSDFKEALRITPEFEQAERNLTQAIRLRSRGTEPQLAPPPRPATAVPR